MKLSFLITLAVSALVLVACGGGDSGTDTSAHSASNPFTIPVKNVPIVRAENLKFKSDGLVGSEPKPIFPEGPPPEFLALQELEDGIGSLAVAGDTVTVQYVGYDYKTRKKFDSSWDQGKPFTFKLGAGEVIEGWDQGLEGMEVSDRRELVIPPRSRLRHRTGRNDSAQLDPDLRRRSTQGEEQERRLRPPPAFPSPVGSRRFRLGCERCADLS
jgi:peptidylprolyl isomerase